MNVKERRWERMIKIPNECYNQSQKKKTNDGLNLSKSEKVIDEISS